MPHGFFQYGAHDTDQCLSTYEDFLVADREGLEHLNQKIGEILDGTDEVTFDEDFSTDLIGIRVGEFVSETSSRSSASESLLTFGCVGILIVTIGFVVLGIWRICEFIGLL